MQASQLHIVQHHRAETVRFVSESIMNVTDPIALKSVIPHYGKLKVADALEFDEASGNFEVLYKAFYIGVGRRRSAQMSMLPQRSVRR